jgi:hypothetical protein
LWYVPLGSGRNLVPRKSPFLITLTRDERAALEAQARKYTSPYRDVIRAKIVLLAAAGVRNDVTPFVSTCLANSSANGGGAFSLIAWRAWKKHREAGAQPALPPSVVVDVKRLACAKLPSRCDVVRFTIPELHAEVLALAIPILQRKPAASWTSMRRRGMGSRWVGPEEFVISADEKPSLQARPSQASDVGARSGSSRR